MKKTERKAETFEAADTFSRCHPLLNFFYFAVVLILTMFSQHPLILAVSYAGAVSYGILLNGAGKTLRQSCSFYIACPFDRCPSESYVQPLRRYHALLYREQRELGDS